MIIWEDTEHLAYMKTEHILDVEEDVRVKGQHKKTYQWPRAV